MELKELRRRAAEFGARLEKVKSEHPNPPEWGWYPFPMLPTFVDQLDSLLTGPNRSLLADPQGFTVADIGAADGDLGFFLGSVGFDVDLIDGGDESIRELRLLPPRRLKDSLQSSVGIFGVDLDHDFRLPRRYDLAFFLGVLYHLKNPFLALETLAHSARYCVVSTKMAHFLSVPRPLGFRSRVAVAEVPVAYLLIPGELPTSDTSNYWVFSESGLRTILERAGWIVLDFQVVGNGKAQPASAAEARAWCLARSTVFDEESEAAEEPGVG